MTDKQKEKIKEKIKRIKLTLAAGKKRFGGFDDSRGLRYAPTKLYLKLGDFDGGLRYLKWFNKNFPNDIGLPEFLFETTVIYFRKGIIREAEAYALKTHFSNKFLFDKYFNRDNRLKDFDYRHDADDYLEFSDWLNKFTQSDKFVAIKAEVDEIEKQLETEPVGPKRTMLVRRLYELI